MSLSFLLRLLRWIARRPLRLPVIKTRDKLFFLYSIKSELIYTSNASLTSFSSSWGNCSINQSESETVRVIHHESCPWFFWENKTISRSLYTKCAWSCEHDSYDVEECLLKINEMQKNNFVRTGNAQRLSCQNIIRWILCESWDAQQSNEIL